MEVRVDFGFGALWGPGVPGALSSTSGRKLFFWNLYLSLVNLFLVLQHTAFFFLQANF